MNEMNTLQMFSDSYLHEVHETFHNFFHIGGVTSPMVAHIATVTLTENELNKSHMGTFKIVIAWNSNLNATNKTD